MNFAVSRTV